jgi:hypothetical protein
MRPHLAVLAAALGWASSSALAQSFAVDAGIGTTGVNANGQLRVLPWMAVRGGYNWLDFEMDDETYDGVTYDAKLDWQNAGLFIDLHPFRNGFTVTGGAYIGDKLVELDATPEESVEIGGQVFTPSEVGQLNGAAEFEQAAPYVGIAWDNALFSDNALSFYARAGVMMSGSADVTLAASGGTLSDDPTFQQLLAQEEAEIEDEIDDYELFPVVGVGVSWRF